jgi:hypothetical protein
MRGKFDSGDCRAKPQEDAMRSRFKISGKLMAAALLVGVLALPAVGGAQTGSNASLGDTLAWLKDFLPTATGATLDFGAGKRVRTTASIAILGGCNVAIVEQKTNIDSPSSVNPDDKWTFSLSDMDPASGLVSSMNGGFIVTLGTSGKVPMVKMEEAGSVLHINYASAGTFADQASAQRVVNALQHAAQLCANAQPF